MQLMHAVLESSYSKSVLGTDERLEGAAALSFYFRELHSRVWLIERPVQVR